MTTEPAVDGAGNASGEGDATSSDATGDDDDTDYRVTVDLDACDGVFACLVRDERFVEADDGLVEFDPATAESVDRTADAVRATFADDRIDDARSAAAACPFDAIAVEERSGTEGVGR